MSAFPDGQSGGPASPSYSHECQNECGRPADTIIVNLTSSDCDILCRTCAVMMFVAVFRQLAETGQLDAAEDVAPAPAS
jgi:hypothetical protein